MPTPPSDAYLFCVNHSAFAFSFLSCNNLLQFFSYFSVPNHNHEYYYIDPVSLITTMNITTSMNAWPFGPRAQPYCTYMHITTSTQYP